MPSKHSAWPPFTRVLGWSNDQIQVMVAGVKDDLSNRKIRSYDISILFMEGSQHAKT
jgi:hypothetical protein